MVQSLVALAINKSEYMVVAEAAKEALWLTVLVKELGIQQGGVQLHCDSQNAHILGKEPDVSCKDRAHRCEVL
jgi:hypothetical protein